MGWPRVGPEAADGSFCRLLVAHLPLSADSAELLGSALQPLLEGQPLALAQLAGRLASRWPTLPANRWPPAGRWLQLGCGGTVVGSLKGGWLPQPRGAITKASAVGLRFLSRPGDASSSCVRLSWPGGAGCGRFGRGPQKGAAGQRLSFHHRRIPGGPLGGFGARGMF
mmetsp:Transcript_65955/g.212752  ORF Transcript_65955/g.212752 Transcript_65955/m.212752 type:complete len:168 (+) Transcript_65955:425-928(+)